MPATHAAPSPPSGSASDDPNITTERRALTQTLEVSSRLVLADAKNTYEQARIRPHFVIASDPYRASVII
jgi:hypothetical protein